MATDPHTSAWVCTTCRKTSGRGEGVIEQVNNDPNEGPIGRLPRHASDDHDLRADPRVKFVAYHNPKCNPHPGQQGYWFAAEPADTLAAWCACIDHLLEKTGWLSRGDIERLNRWWFENRGLNVHQVGP